MLEVIGFIALAYLFIKFAPAILEGIFKFAVICIGFVAFLIVCSWVTSIFQEKVWLEKQNIDQGITTPKAPLQNQKSETLSVLLLNKKRSIASVESEQKIAKRDMYT